jgi:hypothetical protein
LTRSCWLLPYEVPGLRNDLHHQELTWHKAECQVVLGGARCRKVADLAQPDTIKYANINHCNYTSYE